jgi:alkanesulfonate monooxygenase SsuD/methylene tetrahydromethanopterin reductase-like flavin-dependent oxidoreductase (luciferase family)
LPRLCAIEDRVRFSVYNTPWSSEPGDDRRLIDLLLEHSLRADADGFAAIFHPEHHTSGKGVISADSLMWAAFLAPQLSQAYLGFSISQVTLHPPVETAERFALLDQLTRGRVLFGVGSGVEAAGGLALGFDVEPRKRSAMAQEILDLLEVLWDKQRDDPPISWEIGPHRGTLLERIVPSLYSSPRPTMMAVGQADTSIVRAARKGWPIFVYAGDGHEANFVRRLALYRRELAAAAHPPEVLERCMRWTTAQRTLVAIADTREEARAELMTVLGYHDKNIQHAFATIARAQELTGFSGPRYAYAKRSDPIFVDNWFLYGTADSVAEEIESMYGRWGIGNFLMSYDWGVSEPECMAIYDGWYRRFVEQVMPRLRDLPVPTDPLAIELPEYVATAGPGVTA